MRGGFFNRHGFRARRTENVSRSREHADVHREQLLIVLARAALRLDTSDTVTVIAGFLQNLIGNVIGLIPLRAMLDLPESGLHFFRSKSVVIAQVTDDGSHFLWSCHKAVEADHPLDGLLPNLGSSPDV